MAICKGNEWLLGVYVLRMYMIHTTTNNTSGVNGPGVSGLENGSEDRLTNSDLVFRIKLGIIWDT